MDAKEHGRVESRLDLRRGLPKGVDLSAGVEPYEVAGGLDPIDVADFHEGALAIFSDADPPGVRPLLGPAADETCSLRGRVGHAGVPLAFLCPILMRPGVWPSQW